MIRPLVSRSSLHVAGLALAMLAAAPAHAVLTCDLDGQPVSPYNGATTAGKSGLMRCKDAATGQVQREQELRNGVFIGAERFYEQGQLTKERRVNEKGNGDGPTKEWALVDGKRMLIREGTDKNGSTVGLLRMWRRDGSLERLTWYGDDGREAAYVEFTKDGKPSGLKCGTKPVFGSEFDDKSACGFAGATTTVLYDSKGRPSSRVAFDQGERRKTEALDTDGKIRDVRETTPTGRVERSFYANGTKQHEVQYTFLAKRPDASPTSTPPSVKTLEQDYAESGKLVHERRWTPTDRGAELTAETTWYLNGQPKAETLIVAGPQGQVRREKEYYDNGTLAFEGDWVVATEGRSRYARDERPAGTHRTYSESGRKRGEQVYDDQGRLTRERAFDESGAVVRDDEVFEDGSRKAVAK